MKTPLDIQFKNFKDDGQIEEIIKSKTAKLDRIYNRIVSCHVLVEQIQHEQHTGHSYHIRITVNIPPHHEIVVKRDPEKGEIGTEHLSKIIREAFESMGRQVKQLSDKQHKKIKAHSKSSEATHAPEEENEEDLLLET